MLGELFLNNIPFYPYLLGFVGLWTCSYGIWAFINFSSSGKWMYPVGSCLNSVSVRAAFDVIQQFQHGMVLQHMLIMRYAYMSAQFPVICMLMLLLTWCLPAVPRCYSAVGAVCVLGSLRCALGILCVRDFAFTN